MQLKLLITSIFLVFSVYSVTGQAAPLTGNNAVITDDGGNLKMAAPGAVNTAPTAPVVTQPPQTGGVGPQGGSVPDSSRMNPTQQGQTSQGQMPQGQMPQGQMPPVLMPPVQSSQAPANAPPPEQLYPNLFPQQPNSSGN
jgi:hypothetical protein